MLRGSTGRYQNWEVVDPEKWVPEGYACVRVDSRGAGRSPGVLDPFSPRETRDFYLCIEWAAEQAWSTGRVGLLGISYPRGCHPADRRHTPHRSRPPLCLPSEPGRLPRASDEGRLARRLLHARARQSPRRAVPSSSEVYGDPLEYPQREAYWGHVNPVGPRSVYDKAKRFGEALAMAYHRAHGVDVRIARIFNTYGPRMRRTDGRAIPAFIAAALAAHPIEIFGDGHQTRSFCYVDDLVEGIFRLAARSGLAGEVVNLGHEGERSILDVARMVTTLTGSASPIVFRPPAPDDPWRLPDLTKARHLLDYTPRVPLEEGLRLTIAWFARDTATPAPAGEERITRAARI